MTVQAIVGAENRGKSTNQGPPDPLFQASKNWDQERDGSVVMAGQLVLDIRSCGPDGAPREERLANAGLIVAAPALYEAASYPASFDIPGLEDMDDSDHVEITVTVGWLREVREAVAKAMGGAR